MKITYGITVLSLCLILLTQGLRPTTDDSKNPSGANLVISITVDAKPHDRAPNNSAPTVSVGSQGALTKQVSSMGQNQTMGTGWNITEMLHKGKTGFAQALTRRAAKRGDLRAMEWMHMMWTKKLATGGENPLLHVLGDEDLLKPVPQMESGLMQMMTWNPPNELPSYKRLYLYQPEDIAQTPVTRNHIVNVCCWDRPNSPMSHEYWKSKGIALDDDCNFDKVTGEWALKPVFNSLDLTKTVVVGNGGFGGSGGVDYLGRKYNQHLRQNGLPPINVIWFAGDSSQNMRAIDKVDVAITYEAVLEQRLLDNGMIRGVAPFFCNFFGLIIPKGDPLKVREFFFSQQVDTDPGPVLVMMLIIIRGMWYAKYDAAGKDTYASRYNFSAMGLRDHMLMMVACQMLAKMLCGDARVTKMLVGYAAPEYWIAKVQEEVNRLRDKIFDFMRVQRGSRGAKDVICDKATNGGDEIYLLWMDASVIRYRQKYPWEIKETALENGMYHINDLSFFTDPNIGELTVLDPSKCDLQDASGSGGQNPACWYMPPTKELATDYYKNLLANPADILLTSRNDKGSPAEDFFNWVRDNRLKQGFWDIDGTPYAPVPFSIDYLNPKFNEFATVLDSQSMWMRATENNEARRSRANLYYWAHTNFAEEHQAYIELQVLKEKGGPPVAWPCTNQCIVDVKLPGKGFSDHIFLTTFLRYLSGLDTGLETGIDSGGRVTTILSMKTPTRKQFSYQDSAAPVDESAGWEPPSTKATKMLTDNIMRNGGYNIEIVQSGEMDGQPPLILWMSVWTGDA